eukprot:12910106-Prorocentrum_lima.AAC.1
MAARLVWPVMVLDATNAWKSTIALELLVFLRVAGGYSRYVLARLLLYGGVPGLRRHVRWWSVRISL